MGVPVDSPQEPDHPAESAAARDDPQSCVAAEVCCLGEAQPSALPPGPQIRLGQRCLSCSGQAAVLLVLKYPGSQTEKAAL